MSDKPLRIYIAKPKLYITVGIQDNSFCYSFLSRIVWSGTTLRKMFSFLLVTLRVKMSLFFLHLVMFHCSSLPVFRTTEKINAKVIHILCYIKKYILETSQPSVTSPCSLVDMQQCLGATLSLFLFPSSG